MSQSNNDVNEKLNSIAEDITEIKVILAKQEVNLDNNTESLKQHMLRTATSEARLELLENAQSKFMGAMIAISGIGALIYALHSMGILQKIL